jgi:hypothetical protein
MGVRTVSDVQLRSTEAARQYVLTARARLQMEERRYGPGAESRRSHQQLQRSLSPEELRKMWPHADVDQALAP